MAVDLDEWAKRYYCKIKRDSPEIFAGQTISLPSILRLLPKNRFRETIALRIASLALQEKNARDFQFFIRTGDEE